MALNKGKKSNVRVIVSGDIVEIYNYERPYVYNQIQKQRDIIRSGRADRREDNLTVAQRYLRRLIFANIEPNRVPSFATFTFAENVQNIKEANLLWTAFIRRLRQCLGRAVKYTVVVEFQKRGAVHYHVLFYDLPESWTKEERKTRHIASLWGHGWVDVRTIQKIRSIRSIGSYVSKYLSKHTLDSRLVGEKAYFSSHGLKKPREIRDRKRAEKVLAELKSCNTYELVYNNDYDTGRSYGVINYKQYIKSDVKYENSCNKRRTI